MYSDHILIILKCSTKFDKLCLKKEVRFYFTVIRGSSRQSLSANIGFEVERTFDLCCQFLFSTDV